MRKLLFPKTFFVVCVLVGLLAACSNSGSGNNQTNSGGESTPLPTLTTIPFFNFVQPTMQPPLQTLAAESTGQASPSASSTTEAPATVESTGQVEATAQATSESAATAETTSAVSASSAAGQQIYVALACNSCHGDKGEGTTKGSALTTYTKSETDFVGFLRSGGTAGASHVYGTDRLSDSDAKTLYAYLQSLTAK